jgi:hypothetical protein
LYGGNELAQTLVSMQRLIGCSRVRRERLLHNAYHGGDGHLVLGQGLADLLDTLLVFLKVQINVDFQLAGIESGSPEFGNGLEIVVEAVGKAISSDRIESRTTYFHV